MSDDGYNPPMSSGIPCACPGPARERCKNWFVTARRGNRSAFNGYHWTPSRYSEVKCFTCGHRWRTMATYVERLPDAPPLSLPENLRPRR